MIEFILNPQTIESILVLYFVFWVVMVMKKTQNGKKKSLQKIFFPRQRGLNVRCLCCFDVPIFQLLSLRYLNKVCCALTIHSHQVYSEK